MADFRKGNGKAVREVCRAFVALCRRHNLLTGARVAINGSKFKAVNARDKNVTEAAMKRRLERIDKSIARYLSQLEIADRHGDAVPQAKVAHLKNKIEKLKEEIVRPDTINAEMLASEDKQISLTDPDARSMATSGKDTGIVGDNVQVAVDADHLLIVAHEVTEFGTDIRQLFNMAEQAPHRIGGRQTRSCHRPRLSRDRADTCSAILNQTSKISLPTARRPATSFRAVGASSRL